MKYSNYIIRCLNILWVIIFPLSMEAQQHRVVYGKEANEIIENKVILNRVEITDSYSRASVKGRTNTGGLIGKTSGEVKIFKTYSSGWVEGENENSGGLVGSSSEMLQTFSSYWDAESSGMSNSASGTGKTKSEMTYPENQNIFEDWDFQQIWNSDINDINGRYPYLSADLPQMYKLQLSPNPILSGTVRGSGSFAQKSHVGISASANEGYQFSNWTSSGNILTQNAQTVVLIPTSDYKITANFTLISGTEDVSSTIKVFPNPLHDFLFINNVSDYKNVLISDIYGRIAQTYELNIDGCYDTSHLLPGYYFVSLIAKDGQIMNFRILKY